MIKKALIAGGALVSAFALTVSLVAAQTPTPSPTTVPRPTASPTTTVPTGAPATGMGAY